jgi:hypothetical protein
MKYLTNYVQIVRFCYITYLSVTILFVTLIFWYFGFKFELSLEYIVVVVELITH